MLIKLQKSSSLFFCAIFVLGHCTLTFANNLLVSNVSLENRDSGGNTAAVEFDISWDNSWRTDNAIPNNYDAVWIFLKICKGTSCAPTSTTPWAHGMLATAGDNPADTDPGSNTDLNIQVTTDRVGAFLFRKTDGTGTMASNNVRLTLKYSDAPLSAGDTDDIQIKVFGAEMVYIPEGDFYIGDGNGTTESSYAFHSGAGNTAVQITSALTSDIRVDSGLDDTQIETTGIGIDGDGGLDTDDDGDIDNASYPTGYTPFYMMKYEITQGQYRDFLNTLNQAQQNTRTAVDISGENIALKYIMRSEGLTSISYRQTIKAISDPANGFPYTFGCDLGVNNILDEYDDGEWIAMNYFSWPDLCAYADWAGLRPITELEFEKTCRGPGVPIKGEYAWGGLTFTYTGAIVNPGQTSEAATATGPGLTNNNTGPMRVGFSATSATTRATAGAGFYGVMNLAENVGESAVTVGNSTGRSFMGTHGDGVLTTTGSYEGSATNTDWPGINATAARGVTGGTGSGNRGGGWQSEPSSISFRSAAALGLDTRGVSLGGRVGRTAP